MLKQPSTNVKMTNVATIRYKINNKSFEIACYRNKALNWRNGVEDDISEVLQIQQIYQNASHGTLAKKSDLNKFFPNKTKLEIIQIILGKGQLQVSDKERQVQQSNLLSDVVNIIVEKCVHPVTKRRFTADSIRQAIKDIYFPIKTDQPAKKQALDCIKALQQKYKISRGLMKIKISCQEDHLQQIEEQLKKIQITEAQSSEKKGNIVVQIYDIQPNKYRVLTQICKKNNKVTVEVLVNVVVNVGSKDLESQQFSALQLINPIKQQKEEDKREVKQGDSKNDKKKVEQKVIKCSTCGEYATFLTAQDQRAHFKSQWHVQNVKRKSKNLAIYSQQDFKIAQFNENYN